MWNKGIDRLAIAVKLRTWRLEVPGKLFEFFNLIVTSVCNNWLYLSHVLHQQFNIQQLYALPTLYLRVLYLSENKQRLVPLTA